MHKVICFSTIISLVYSYHYFDQISSYNTVCKVSSSGAKCDGKTDDTSAIQKAINTCLDKGSSAQIVIDKGSCVSGPLQLTTKCSNCAFTINSGATLLISTDESKFKGKDFLTIENQNNFVFEGPGTINGQGETWWKADNGGPKTIYAKSSTGFVVDNIKVENCPYHCLEMYTDRTEIKSVTIQNPPSSGSGTISHNTDGVDVHGQPFYIHDSTINTGDDNIAFHANDTLVSNCKFGTGHGTSIGSLSGGWLKNITVTGCSYTDTTQAIRIKVDNTAGPGKLWDVTFESLTVNKVQQTVVITEFYNNNKQANCRFQIDGVTLKDISGTQSGSEDVGIIDCQKSSPCKNIKLDNVKISGGKQEWDCQEASVSATSVSPSISC
eukprot:149769_1